MPPPPKPTPSALDFSCLCPFKKLLTLGCKIFSLCNTCWCCMLLLCSGGFTVKHITVCRYTSERSSIVIRYSQASAIMIVLSFILYRDRRQIIQYNMFCHVILIVCVPSAFRSWIFIKCAVKKELMYLMTTVQLRSQRADRCPRSSLYCALQFKVSGEQQHWLLCRYYATWNTLHFCANAP